MKKLFISSTAADEIKTELERLYDVRLLPAFDALSGPVSSHADMLCGIIGEKMIVNRFYIAVDQKMM